MSSLYSISQLPNKWDSLTAIQRFLDHKTWFTLKDEPNFQTPLKAIETVNDWVRAGQNPTTRTRWFKDHDEKVYSMQIVQENPIPPSNKFNLSLTIKRTDEAHSIQHKPANSIFVQPMGDSDARKAHEAAKASLNSVAVYFV